jgi:DMSO reductase anchor subunit
MRPAYSVILFTTLSGAGFGLLAVLGAMLSTGAEPEQAVAGLALGLALASVGLLSSTFHLGRPERAWRAFSQWRTSWLSREGVAALSVYAVALPLAGMLLVGGEGSIRRLLAAATAILGIATVGCTAMIYASLKPIPQWRHWAVLPVYLCLAIGTGSLVLATLSAGSMLPWLAVVALGAAWLGKEAYWRHAGTSISLDTAAATGLSEFGRVRMLDPPHTESNYLLHEMGYRVGRRHAERLRRISRATAFLLPIAAGLALALANPPPGIRGSLAGLAACSALLGTLVERWLFFAEARHAVTLYYGAHAV